MSFFFKYIFNVFFFLPFIFPVHACAVCRVMEDIMCVDEQTVQRLTDGFLSHYLPELSSSKRALQELTYDSRTHHTV